MVLALGCGDSDAAPHQDGADGGRQERQDGGRQERRDSGAADAAALDGCDPDPCEHGRCVVEGAEARCDCDPEWSGARCELAPDDCTPNPCENGGGCSMLGPGEYACACAGGYSGEHCEDPPPGTESCVLRYELSAGNSDDGDGYTGSNIRIRDTTLGIGDGTHGAGPGTLILRVSSDGDSNISAGAAAILYLHLPQEFVSSSGGITVTTDVDAFAPALGATDSTTALAIGTLSLGATPKLTWNACSYPAGYDDSTTSFTPDVVGTGSGCLKGYHSVGNVNCLDESPLAGCASGGLNDGDNAQDETWEQALQTLTFSAGLESFSMPFMQVPNRSPSRTYISWGGTLVTNVCK